MHSLGYAQMLRITEIINKKYILNYYKDRLLKHKDIEMNFNYKEMFQVHGCQL